MVMTAEKKGKEKYKRVYLTSDDVSAMLVKYTNGISKNAIANVYGITYGRVNNIINGNRGRIEQLHTQQAIEKEKQFRVKVIDKRSEIIDKITPEDIENASLSQKTSSIVDLTKVKQLEEGGSTENIAININTSSKQDVLDYIMRDVNVNEKSDKEPINAIINEK